MTATPIVLVTLSARDLPAILGSEAPLAAFLAATAGPTIAGLVSAGVALALFNALIATIMIFARFLYATGRDGLWAPSVNRVLTPISSVRRTPWGSTIVLVVLAAGFSLLGARAILILMAGDVLPYALLAAAVWAGRRSGRTGRWFRAPLHPLTPVLAFVFTGVALAANWSDLDAGRPSTVVLVGLYALSIGYYGLRLRGRANPFTGPEEAGAGVAEPARI